MNSGGIYIESMITRKREIRDTRSTWRRRSEKKRRTNEGSSFWSLRGKKRGSVKNWRKRIRLKKTHFESKSGSRKRKNCNGESIFSIMWPSALYYVLNREMEEKRRQEKVNCVLDPA